MRYKSYMTIVLIILWSTVNMSAKLLPKVNEYVTTRIQEFHLIGDDRKLELEEISKYVKENIDKKNKSKLTFICTHNSRRSHMAQIWAQVAADYYDIDMIECYSGGTEATAFNKRSVAALNRAGLDIQTIKEGNNPVYETKYAIDKNTILGFSKVYSDKANPNSDFAAIMVCSDADEACPFVSGASERIAIPYEDPKKFDDTGNEANAYDERSKQIAREMLYVFSKIK